MEVEGGKREKGKREKERRSESLYDLDLKLLFHNIQMSPFPNSRPHTRMYNEKDTIDHPWFIPHMCYISYSKVTHKVKADSKLEGLHTTKFDLQ